MYRNDWHYVHREKTSNSANTIANIILKHFDVQSALDVGCGHGDWLECFLKLGVADVSGCDGPWTDTKFLRIPTERFFVQDLREQFSLNRKFDIVISTEVAEHF